jgi:hypothetical protein
MKSQADLDVATFLASNPTEIEAGGYPKLMYNVNLPPMLVRDAGTEQSIGSAWRPVDLSEPEDVPLPDVPPVEIAPASQSTPAMGGAYSFTVTITGEGTSGTWEATSDAVATWLTITSPTTPQTVDGPVNYTVAANVGAARSAAIYVNGKTHMVSQAAA